jgi:hypothetical protein
LPDGGRSLRRKVLKTALENYRKARGRYPNFPGNPVSDLRKDLVDGGFLKSIPNDPSPDKRCAIQIRSLMEKAMGC